MVAGARALEESPGSTEQGARRKPGRYPYPGWRQSQGAALLVPARARVGPRESNRNEPAAPAARMKRAILPAAISDPVARSPWAADGDSPRPKVESSRGSDDAARPVMGRREMAISAAMREQNPAYAPDTPDALWCL